MMTQQHTASTLEHEQLLEHLSHEIRQPLSGIESTAYYLDMVAGRVAPELKEHCKSLRRMVEHAHWVVEDASLSLRMLNCAQTDDCLAAALQDLGAELALHDEPSVEVNVDPTLRRVRVPDGLLRPFCAHVMNFLRPLASAHDSVRVVVSNNDRGSVYMEIVAEGAWDGSDLVRKLAPPSKSSAIRRFIELAGGDLELTGRSNHLRVLITLPTAE